MPGVADQYDPWLDPRVFPDADDLTDAELAFVGGVRDGMAGCRSIPDVRREDDGRLLVSVCIAVRDTTSAAVLGVADYGVVFDGVTAEADVVNGHAMRFADEPTPERRTFTGAPADVGARSGEWLLRWAERPVVRSDWLHRGQVVMSEWAFADSGKVLCVRGASGQRRHAIRRRPPDRVIEALTM
jgi:hypothetical protein